MHKLHSMINMINYVTLIFQQESSVSALGDWIKQYYNKSLQSLYGWELGDIKQRHTIISGLQQCPVFTLLVSTSDCPKVHTVILKRHLNSLTV